jgi:MFS family permease
MQGVGGPSADPRYGWVVVGILGTTETVSYGVLYYAFGVFLVAMRPDLGLSTQAATGAFSLALAVAGLVGLWVGRWLDSHGPRALMTIGSATGGLLVLAWSQVHSAVQLYAVFAGIGVAMALVLYEPAFIVVTRWFSVRRHQALTAVTLVAALASFIFSPLSAWLIGRLGWREALVVLAVILASVTVPLHAFGLRSPPPPATSVDRRPAGERHAGDRSLLRRPGFGSLTACFVLLSLVSSALGVLLVSLLVSRGWTTAFAAGVAGMVGVSQVPGRLVFALVARRVKGWPFPAAVFGLGAVAIAVLAVGHSAATVIGFAVAYGMSNGMATLMRAALVADLYGRIDYGRISSTTAAFVAAARALAPFAAATTALLPGGSLTVLWAMAGASAIAAGLGARAVATATRR